MFFVFNLYTQITLCYMKLLYTLTLLLLLISCNNDTSTKYLYTKPEAVVFDILNGETPEGSTVTYDANLITIMMHASKFTYSSNFDFSLINKAYATTPDRHTITGLEKIKNIQVYTINDYSSTFSAGSNITDSCLFGLHGTSGDSSWYTPVVKDSLNRGQIIAELNKFDKNGDNYYDYGAPQPLGRFSFRVNHPPNHTGKQQFAIFFETDTPSRFGDSTITFILKP